MLLCASLLSSSDENTKRDTGRKAQLTNIAAAKVRIEHESEGACSAMLDVTTWIDLLGKLISLVLETPLNFVSQFCFCLMGMCVLVLSHSSDQAVSDIIRTTLGPRAMLKMILDASGGIVLTNDGNAILREIDVNHPAAKSMIELSRTQDEEVGDGTTSVTVLAGELLSLSEQFLERNFHPTVIVNAYFRALDDAMILAEKLSMPIDTSKPEEMTQVVASCVGTKYVHRYRDLMVRIAIDAVNTVKTEAGDKISVDFKNFAKVEKIPGGDVTDSVVLKGVMFNKDVVSGNMRRHIKNPRILLLDSPIEYRKGESQTNIEVTRDEDWQRLLELEEEYVKKLCDDILATKPDVVVTEKGISDLALHFLAKGNVSCIRRLRKTDNSRLSRACGAKIVSRVDEIKVGLCVSFGQGDPICGPKYTSVSGARALFRRVILVQEQVCSKSRRSQMSTSHT